MKIAIYPGSFDPITSGHLNIIRRASQIFDQLIVCVMVNATKSPMFSQDERVSMIRKVVGDLPNVEGGCLSGAFGRVRQAEGRLCHCEGVACRFGL